MVQIESLMMYEFCYTKKSQPEYYSIQTSNIHLYEEKELTSKFLWVKCTPDNQNREEIL